jgi:hypothetical protein
MKHSQVSQASKIRQYVTEELTVSSTDHQKGMFICMYFHSGVTNLGGKLISYT